MKLNDRYFDHSARLTEKDMRVSSSSENQENSKDKKEYKPKKTEPL